MKDAKIDELTADDHLPLITYHNAIAQMICNPAQPACYLSNCNKCPGVSAIKDRLLEHMDNKLIDTVTFQQWVSVDRCKLETVCKSADEFVQYFGEKLCRLLPHSFIATQQAALLTHKKENLTTGEFLVTADFLENYAFILQDAIQGFHWNNSQSTVHPFVIYFKNELEDKVNYISYVIISECLQHNTVAAYLFQQCLIEYLKQQFTPVKKIYYFCDGAASHYKNRKSSLIYVITAQISIFLLNGISQLLLEFVME